MMNCCIKIFVFFIQLLIVYGKDKEKLAVGTVLSDLNRNISRDAAALRYGFHKTWECQEFDKAFLCIQKCLDLNYDIAYSNKRCSCTCYYNRYKAKYTVARNFTLTRWKSGAPTTSLPPWAKKDVFVKGIGSLELSDKDESRENKIALKQENPGSNGKSSAKTDKPGITDDGHTKSLKIKPSETSLQEDQSHSASPQGEGGTEDAGKLANENAGTAVKEQSGPPTNDKAEKPPSDLAGNPADEHAGEPPNVNAGVPANEEVEQPANVGEPTGVNAADPKVGDEPAD